MDNRDLVAALKTVRLKTVSVCDYLAEQNINMAFMSSVEAENRLDRLIESIESEIASSESPTAGDGPGPCSYCPSTEAYWCVDPYMLDLYDVTNYMVLCAKCYQDRLDDI